jgi:1,4-alpha-glucan branching enzyme
MLHHALTLLLDGWDRGAHPMKKNDYGVFELTIPAQNGQAAIPHNSKLKVCKTSLTLSFRF